MLLLIIPQLFLLIGVYLFLAGSVVTILFSEYYPKPLPYLLSVGSLIGFILLWLGKRFWITLGNMQLTYCISFAAIAFISLLVSNLYPLLAKKNRSLSMIFSVVITLPACLTLLFFSYTYLNAIPLELPLMPALPPTILYMLFFAAIIVLAIDLILEYPPKR